MARSVFYRGCEIISGPSRHRSDQDPNLFDVNLTVRYFISGTLVIERPRIPNDKVVHSSEEAADDFSIAIARSWIDRLLDQSQ